MNGSNEEVKGLKIQICSDLHLEFYEKIQVPELIVPSAPYLALLGDIGLPIKENYEEFLLKQSELYEEVFIVAGIK